MEIIVDIKSNVYKEPIVRCRDCKYWANNCYHDNDNATKCKFDGYSDANDYCSKGEAKK